MLKWEFSTGIVLVFIHYGRRVLECLFVHKYSNPTKPITDFFTLAIHYWAIFGSLVGYCIFNPTYVSPDIGQFKYWLYVLTFFLTEALNCGCHFVLSSLRKTDKDQRAIPYVLFL